MEEDKKDKRKKKVKLKGKAFKCSFQREREKERTSKMKRTWWSSRRSETVQVRQSEVRQVSRARHHLHGPSPLTP